MAGQNDSSSLDERRKRAILDILTTPIGIASRTMGLPHLQMRPEHFIKGLYAALSRENIAIADVRLEGSAATAVMSLCDDIYYNDLDVVFHLSDKKYETLARVRDVLLQFFRMQTPALQFQDPYSLVAAYFSKMFITPPPENENRSDAWALFTLPGAFQHPSLDLKFVQTLATPYQYSINSFQIILPIPGTSDFRAEAPEAFKCECMYGSIDEAIRHWKDKIIAVKDVEIVAHMHGGGLLKYASLRSGGFQVLENLDVGRMERFMVARFETDFPPQNWNARLNTPVQCQRIRDYMLTHMHCNYQEQFNFLVTLSLIVKRVKEHDSSTLSKYIAGFLHAAHHLIEIRKQQEQARLQAGENKVETDQSKTDCEGFFAPDQAVHEVTRSASKPQAKVELQPSARPVALDFSKIDILDSGAVSDESFFEGPESDFDNLSPIGTAFNTTTLAQTAPMFLEA